MPEKFIVGYPYKLGYNVIESWYIRVMKNYELFKIPGWIYIL